MPFIGEFGFGPNGYAGKPGTLKVFRVFVVGLCIFPLSFAILKLKETGCFFEAEEYFISGRRLSFRRC